MKTTNKALWIILMFYLLYFHKIFKEQYMKHLQPLWPWLQTLQTGWSFMKAQDLILFPLPGTKLFCCTKKLPLCNLNFNQKINDLS